MAEDHYAAYCHEFGYPPAQPGHLIAFAKKSGVKVTWKECKSIMIKAPDTSNWNPPKKDYQVPMINNPPKPKKTEQEKKIEKMETAKRYSNHKINIDEQQLMGINKRRSADRYKYLLTQLTAMGWNYDQSLAALKESKGNLQLAMDALINANYQLNHPTISHKHAGNGSNGQQQSKEHINYQQAAPQHIQQTVQYDQPIDYQPPAPQHNMQNDQSINYQQKNDNQQQPQQQQQQQQSQPQVLAFCINDAFDKLLGGHGSIKQRLRAMDEIYENLDSLDIATDKGKVLLSTYTEQILHEDYIYHDYAVRIKSIQQISDVFIFCLNKLHYQQIPDLIDESLPSILNNLYKLLDDNRCRKFHEMIRECLDKIIDAVIGKNNKRGIINLCGLMNEKINSENINQPHARFFTAKQIFEKLIFGNNNIKIINDMFNIDIAAFSNKIEQYTNGININQESDLPQNKQWLNLLITNNWNNNDDETFKDIISDCLSIMIIDPNHDLSIIGSNLVVYFNEFNKNFKNYLEVEAKYRFAKYLVVDNNTNKAISTAPTTETIESESEQPIQPQAQKNNYQSFKEQHNGEQDYYRIQQLTAVNVAAPTLPSI